MPQVLTLNIDGHNLYEEKSGKALFYYIGHFSGLKLSLNVLFPRETFFVPG